MRLVKASSGQSLTETVILAPLFLTMAFGIVQIGHLGIGVAMVHYSASAIARLAVQENGFNQGEADQRFKSLLAAGLKSVGVVSKTVDSDAVTSDIAVTACAQLPAYPFIGPLLQKAFQGQATMTGCQSGGSWISLVGPAPYHFIVRGQASARMNYSPNAGG